MFVTVCTDSSAGLYVGLCCSYYTGEPMQHLGTTLHPFPFPPLTSFPTLVSFTSSPLRYPSPSVPPHLNNFTSQMAGQCRDLHSRSRRPWAVKGGVKH